MSRWRPPGEKSSPYITAQGYQVLRDEYEHLWSQRRPEVVKALAAAAAEGDRSENAEYQYRKKELREIDRRVRYLQVRIPQLKVAGQPPADAERVYFGAWVDLSDAQGVESRYRIVGPDETDASVGQISVDSPMARALLGRRIADVVNVSLPSGVRELEIVDVSYDA